jgi:hypothetical protein
MALLTGTFLRASLTATLAGSALVLSGCFPVTAEPFISAGLTVAQEGTSSFRQGAIEAAIRQPMATVHAAALRAVESWSLTSEVVELDGRRGIITAREAGGRLIEITCEPVSPVVTALRIKVGFWGDQPVSRLLLEEVLGELPPR